MQKAKDSGVHLPGKPQNIEAKSPVPKPWQKLVHTSESLTYGSRNRIIIWC
jgi:hypothetical protein